MFSAEVLKASEKPAPAMEHDIYIVFAVYNNESRWTIPGQADGLYTSLEAAQKAADRLAFCWHHPRVVRIGADVLREPK